MQISDTSLSTASFSNFRNTDTNAARATNCSVTSRKYLRYLTNPDEQYSCRSQHCIPTFASENVDTLHHSTTRAKIFSETKRNTRVCLHNIIQKIAHENRNFPQRTNVLQLLCRDPHNLRANLNRNLSMNNKIPHLFFLIQMQEHNDDSSTLRVENWSTT